MENKTYRKIDVVIDREEVLRSVMAEYALISAGKNDDRDVPMQYAKCDLAGIFGVVMDEEVGYICSRMMGYAEDCVADGSLMKITVRVSAQLEAAADAVLRKRIEGYLVAAILMRFLMPVASAQRECVALEKRAKSSLRAVRNILAVD